MGNASNPESYVKWILVFLHAKEEKKLREKLTIASESLKKVLKDIRNKDSQEGIHGTEGRAGT
jgi:hypothetical protein